MSAEHIKFIRMVQQKISGYDRNFYFGYPFRCVGFMSAVSYQNLKTSCYFDPVIFLNRITPVVSSPRPLYRRLL